MKGDLIFAELCIADSHVTQKTPWTIVIILFFTELPFISLNFASARFSAFPVNLRCFFSFI